MCKTREYDCARTTNHRRLLILRIIVLLSDLDSVKACDCTSWHFFAIISKLKFHHSEHGERRMTYYMPFPPLSPPMLLSRSSAALQRSEYHAKIRYISSPLGLLRPFSSSYPHTKIVYSHTQSKINLHNRSYYQLDYTSGTNQSTCRKSLPKTESTRRHPTRPDLPILFQIAAEATILAGLRKRKSTTKTRAERAERAERTLRMISRTTRKEASKQRPAASLRRQ
jgi:hypothetical protein